MPRSDAPCVCGHRLSAHEHYRDGSNCGTCGPVLCPAYRRARWWRRARRRPASTSAYPMNTHLASLTP